MQNTPNKNIIFVHLWNNFSGSPNVLRTVVDGLNELGYTTNVISSFNNKGFLSGVKGNKINVNYRFEKNIFLRLWQFIRFQALASNCVRKSKKNDIIYINTIQPFLPALTARVLKRKVVYHIHEAYPKPGFFQRFLFFIVKKTATQIICVSDYVKENLDDSSKAKASVVYNSLSPDFVSGIMRKVKGNDEKKVLMISSAREYKGVFQFCDLAKMLPDYNFTLICEATQNEIDKFFADYKDVASLCLIPTQENLHKHYASSDLIVNFSNPRMIIETFGLTILEGMYYGLPAIVPPVGGISELVSDGYNGFKIDINDTDKVKNTLIEIFSDENSYTVMSENAIKKSKEFNVIKQIESIDKILNV